eukprot:TRINITY_DN3229_c0_g1_i2.p1 TRINITY_DN3229_c0_g1~~TRINITY_DN3229_c0_g1_i2.p1  ORF type:complete len:866 (-),score=209.56 TRINITY_DN3229_c0_g1_i2:166-2727(-)
MAKPFSRTSTVHPMANMWKSTDANKSLSDIPLEAVESGRVSLGPHNVPFPQFVSNRRSSLFPLFRYPLIVDHFAARIYSLQVVIICILGMIFRKKDTMEWIIVGLAGSYAITVFAGSRWSPLGWLADLIAWLTKKHDLAAGPPKQFAAMCGLALSGVAMIVSKSVGSPKDEWVPFAFLLALACAAASEAFFNFCFGCKFFELGIKFGLVNKEVTAKANRALRDHQAALDEEHRLAELHHNANPVYRMIFNGQKFPTPADLVYKAREEDDHKPFNAIKYIQINHFAMPMGMLGLAIAFRRLHEEFPNGAVKKPNLWQGLAVTATVVFLLVLALYFTKVIVYLKKVRKEFNHPVRGHFFSMPLLCILLIAYLAYDASPKKDLEGHNNVTRILFWIAGPLQLFLSTVFVGRFTTGVQRFRQFVNPSMMIPVVGNFIAALVIPYVKSNDMEAGDFTNAGWGWYGIAWTFWIVLLAINIHRMATDSPVEDRERALHMMFVAAPAMACSSYLALNNRQWDNFALINFWTAWLIQMSFFFGGYFRYFGAHKFEMSFWGYTFPFAALTVASINYYTLVTNHKSRALVLVSLTFATFSVVQCTWHTLNGLIKRQILIPEEKWGPLSMMKLTHHAFKFAAKQIDRQVKLFSDPPSAEEARAEFLRLWGGFFITYQEHARHEEEVVYLRFGELFPGITERTHGDHEEHGAHAEALNASINRFAAMPLAQGLAFFHQEVQPSLIAFMTELIKHLEFEEIHINPIPRKHIPLEMHIELLRSLFELTSANAWQIIIPFVLENQELHGRRTRYLRCLRWGLPDHMAQISRIVLLGTDQFMWERLTQEIPELEVNRHHTGARHTGRRYY